MGTNILRFLGQLTPTATFDIARTRSRIEAMSDVKLLKYGYKRSERRNGKKRSLTMIEICEFQVAREEWQKRKTLSCAKISA